MSYFGSTDFLFEVSKGNVTGHAIGFIVGSSQHIQPAKTQTIWDVDEDYAYLSADTQLYISSSDALDTAVTVIVTGLDDTYAEVTRSVTVNGQTQVALSGLMFRVHAALVTSSVTPVGDLYVSESTALTAGVPNDLTKVKAKIPLSGIDIGTDFASDNFSHLGIYTVPANKTLHILQIQINVEKNQDVRFSGRLRSENGAWFNRNPVPLYQGQATQNFLNFLPAGEKTDFEFRALSSNANTTVQFQMQFILVDNSL